MEITSQGGITIPQNLPGARSTDLPVATKVNLNNDNALPATNAASEHQQMVQAEEKRLAAVQKAAENYFKDVYAVSDTRFTIYKDSAGQYITRYTSLRDGKVTYVPEPDMLAYMERRQQARQAMLELRV